MNYGFRVRFVLAPGRRIGCQDKTLTLETAGCETFKIEAVEGVPLIETSNLSIISLGYDNEESARLVGQRVKDALLLASASICLGADMGRQKALSWVNPEIFDKIREEHGVQHINDVHGLSVFSAELPIVVGYSSGASLTVNMRADQLQQSFTQSYNFADRFTERQKLAAELINLIHFERSLRARFLTLMTALEVLAKPKSKKQSLTQACKDKVAKCLGDSTGAEVPQLYDLRSRIIHDGAGISADEVNSQTSRLLEIVTSTLLADVRGSAT